jgi:hypothetical protein
LTFIFRGLPVKTPKCETRPMTEPAVLLLELRSCLFDGSSLRDRWPRLQFAYTGSEAAVTAISTCLRTSDHKRIYCAMPMNKVAIVDLRLKSTSRRAEDVNYANCGRWNGWSGLSDCTLRQRRDNPRCGALVSSGKLLKTRTFPAILFPLSTEHAVDHF